MRRFLVDICHTKIYTNMIDGRENYNHSTSTPALLEHQGTHESQKKTTNDNFLLTKKKTLSLLKLTERKKTHTRDYKPWRAPRVVISHGFSPLSSPVFPASQKKSRFFYFLRKRKANGESVLLKKYTYI